MKSYHLSKADRDLVAKAVRQAMAEQARRPRIETRAQPANDGNEYWAEPPEGSGFPAATVDAEGIISPSGVYCRVFTRGDDGKLLQLKYNDGRPVLRAVFNYTKTALAGRAKISQHRDGTWVIGNTPTEAGGGPDCGCVGFGVWVADSNLNWQWPTGQCGNNFKPTSTTATSTTTTSAPPSTSPGAPTTTFYVPTSSTQPPVTQPTTPSPRCRDSRCLLVCGTSGPAPTTGSGTTGGPATTFAPALVYHLAGGTPCPDGCTCFGLGDSCWYEGGEVVSVCMGAESTATTTTWNPGGLLDIAAWAVAAIGTIPPLTRRYAKRTGTDDAWVLCGPPLEDDETDGVDVVMYKAELYPLGTNPNGYKQHDKMAYVSIYETPYLRMASQGPWPPDIVVGADGKCENCFERGDLAQRLTLDADVGGGSIAFGMYGFAEVMHAMTYKQQLLFWQERDFMGTVTYTSPAIQTIGTYPTGFYRAYWESSGKTVRLKDGSSHLPPVWLPMELDDWMEANTTEAEKGGDRLSPDKYSRLMATIGLLARKKDLVFGEEAYSSRTNIILEHYSYATTKFGTKTLSDGTVVADDEEEYQYEKLIPAPVPIPRGFLHTPVITKPQESAATKDIPIQDGQESLSSINDTESCGFVRPDFCPTEVGECWVGPCDPDADHLRPTDQICFPDKWPRGTTTGGPYPNPCVDVDGSICNCPSTSPPITSACPPTPSLGPVPCAGVCEFYSDGIRWHLKDFGCSAELDYCACPPPSCDVGEVNDRTYTLCYNKQILTTSAPTCKCCTPTTTIEPNCSHSLCHYKAVGAPGTTTAPTFVWELVTAKGTCPPHCPCPEPETLLPPVHSCSKLKLRCGPAPDYREIKVDFIDWVEETNAKSPFFGKKKARGTVFWATNVKLLGKTVTMYDHWCILDLPSDDLNNFRMIASWGVTESTACNAAPGDPTPFHWSLTDRCCEESPEAAETVDGGAPESSMIAGPDGGAPDSPMDGDTISGGGPL